MYKVGDILAWDGKQPALVLENFCNGAEFRLLDLKTREEFWRNPKELESAVNVGTVKSLVQALEQAGHYNQ